MNIKKMKRKSEYKKMAQNIIEKIPKICKNGHMSRLVNKNNCFNYRCKYKFCLINFNILNNTPFKGSRIDIWKILKIYDLWLFGLKIKDICFVSRISKKTIINILFKFEKYLEPRFYNQIKPIGGENIIVEIDESKFGKVKYHRGHRVDGVWVFGMVERTPARRIILLPVENRTADTLINLLKKYVLPGSIIYSDCFKSYSNVSNYFKEHCTVNHSLYFVTPYTDIHTNTIEGNWNGVKMSTPIRKRTKKLIGIQLIRYMLKRENNNIDVFDLIKLII